MVYQLKLQNVTQYGADANPESIGPKYYGITAQNPDTGITSKLTLNNIEHVQNSKTPSGDSTFDVRFEHIDRSADASKEIFHIEGLKIDGAVQYDPESHTFVAAIDESQEAKRLGDYTDCLNSLMNDHSDLFI